MDLIYPHHRPNLTREDLLEVYAWPEEGSYLRANMAASIDGSARDDDGRSEGISSPADKDVFKLLRHTADAVVVGAGTVTAENYGPMPMREEWQSWRAANDRSPLVPVVVVVTNHASISPEARVFSGPPGSALVATAGSADPERLQALRQVTEVIVVGDDKVDVPTLRSALTERGLLRLLTEGGPHFLASTLPILDELCLTTSPLILGAPVEGARPAPDLLGGMEVASRKATLKSVIAADDSLLVVWNTADR